MVCIACFGSFVLQKSAKRIKGIQRLVVSWNKWEQLALTWTVFVNRAQTIFLVQEFARTIFSALENEHWQGQKERWKTVQFFFDFFPEFLGDPIRGNYQWIVEFLFRGIQLDLT